MNGRTDTHFFAHCWLIFNFQMSLFSFFLFAKNTKMLMKCNVIFIGSLVTKKKYLSFLWSARLVDFLELLSKQEYVLLHTRILLSTHRAINHPEICWENNNNIDIKHILVSFSSPADNSFLLFNEWQYEDNVNKWVSEGIGDL